MRDIFTGCSQLPSGPSSRLYSPKLSDLLACAVSAGLEERIAGKVVHSRRPCDSFNDDAENPGAPIKDGRAQVGTLRLGSNRHSLPSWRRLLEALSCHPPQELDLSFASVLLATDHTLTADTPAATIAAPGIGTASGMKSGLPPMDHNRDLSAPREQETMPMAERTVTEARKTSASEMAPSTGDLPLSLGELLAAAVLPSDAPGVQILNLTGSVGLLLPSHHVGGVRVGEDEADQGVKSGAEGDDRNAFLQPAAPSSSNMDTLITLLQDALMSPLCIMTHLLLSGIQGSSPSLYPPPLATASAPAVTSLNDASATTGRYQYRACRRPRVFGPAGARSLCEAASSCLSLRYLDLAGCDLSGSLGAAAAAAAVSCLIRGSVDRDGGGGDIGGSDSNTARFGLTRLNLRACNLGVRGLSSIFGALVAASFFPEQERAPWRGDAFGSTDIAKGDGSSNSKSTGASHDNLVDAQAVMMDGAVVGASAVMANSRSIAVAFAEGGRQAGRRRRRPHSRLPRFLDLSDNDASPTMTCRRAPSVHASSAEVVDMDVEQDAQLGEDRVAVAMKTLVSSIDLLSREKLVSVRAEASFSIRYGGEFARVSPIRTLVDLSGNGLGKPRS